MTFEGFAGNAAGISVASAGGQLKTCLALIWVVDRVPHYRPLYMSQIYNLKIG